MAVHFIEINIAGMVRAFREVVRLGAPGDFAYKEAKRLLAFAEQMVREVNKTDLDSFIKGQDCFERGMQLMETGQWARAIDAYKESLEHTASTPQPFGNMGICYASMANKEAALEAFDKALAIDPNYELAIVNKIITEKLAPGEALDTPIRSVEYYKEYNGKERSYIEELVRQKKDQTKTGQRR
jgi:lipoprotein NlpI